MFLARDPVSLRPAPLANTRGSDWPLAITDNELRTRPIGAASVSERCWSDEKRCYQTLAISYVVKT